MIYYLVYLLVFYLAYLLIYYLTYFLVPYLIYLIIFYLTYFLIFYLIFYLIFFFWHIIWFLRSSGVYWARKAQIEVQWCVLSSVGPRSVAYWARKVPGWGPVVRTELGRSQIKVQQCVLSSETGEELGQELTKYQEKEEKQ